MKKCFLISTLCLIVSNTYADQNKIMIAKNICDQTEKLALIAQKERQNNLLPSETTNKLLNYLGTQRLVEIERESLTKLVFVTVSEAYKVPLLEDRAKKENVISSFAQYSYRSCLDAMNKNIF